MFSKYNRVELEIIEFDVEDIITDSNGHGEGGGDAGDDE